VDKLRRERDSTGSVTQPIPYPRPARTGTNNPELSRRVQECASATGAQKRQTWGLRRATGFDVPLSRGHATVTAAPAEGFQVARAAGVEGEVDLPYAGIQQLCRPMLETIAELPEPQSRVLQIAFGLDVGDAPERYIVGLALLSLLSEAASAQPLLFIVDDAHWLDPATGGVRCRRLPRHGARGRVGGDEAGHQRRPRVPPRPADPIESRRLRDPCPDAVLKSDFSTGATPETAPPTARPALL
jgi:hypothetical protein